MDKRTALIVIDVQQGFNEEFWGTSNNPECEVNILALLEKWRSNDWPVVLVRHDSISLHSPLRPGQPGNDFMPGIAGKHDLLITKTVNSAFYGTPNLADWLKKEAINSVVICGITTNHCCETTARMAGNLGYEVTFVIDATRTFDFKDMKGQVIKADEMARVTGANLQGEFAQVVSANQLT